MFQNIALQHIGQELQHRDGKRVVAADDHLARGVRAVVLALDLVLADGGQCLLDGLAQPLHHGLAHVLRLVGRVQPLQQRTDVVPLRLGQAVECRHELEVFRRALVPRTFVV